MSLVSVHLGFAQAVNGVGIGFAAPRVEGQQPYGKQSQRHTAQAGIAIVHREGGEHRAADNRADGIAEVNSHQYIRADEQLSAALKNGTYAFRLHMPSQSITTDTRQLGLIREFPDCSFFLDFMDTDCTYSDDLLELTCSCDNLAFLVPFGSLQSRQLVDLLNARQRIYGVCRTYDNTNAAERISDSQISEMLSWGSPLLFFLAAADTTQDNRLLVDNAILDARLHQTYPALLIHLDADVARIQQLLL